jgi:hypothetical protein
MEMGRIADVVLGTTMVALGVLPTGLLVLGRGRTMLFLDGAAAGVLPERVRMLLLVVLCVCGLVLAAVGVLTIRHGRSRSSSTGLY